MINLRTFLFRSKIVFGALLVDGKNLPNYLGKIQNRPIKGWANIFDLLQNKKLENRQLNRAAKKRCRSEKYPLSSELDVAEFLYNLSRAKKLKNIIEIGVYKGACSLALAQAINENGGGILNLIDINSYFLSEIERPLRKKFPKVKLKLHIGSSCKISDQKKLQKVDLIFLDADHSYKSVLNDLINLFPILKKGGFCVVHDSMMWDGVQGAIKKYFLNAKIITIATSCGSGLSIIKK